MISHLTLFHIFRQVVTVNNALLGRAVQQLVWLIYYKTVYDLLHMQLPFQVAVPVEKVQHAAVIHIVYTIVSILWTQYVFAYNLREISLVDGRGKQTSGLEILEVLLEPWIGNMGERAVFPALQVQYVEYRGRNEEGCDLAAVRADGGLQCHYGKIIRRHFGKYDPCTRHRTVNISSLVNYPVVRYTAEQVGGIVEPVGRKSVGQNLPEGTQHDVIAAHGLRKVEGTETYM